MPAPDPAAPPEARHKAHLQRFMHRSIAPVWLAEQATRASQLEECLPELEKIRELRPGDERLLMNLHWMYERLRDREPKKVDEAYAKKAEEVLAAFVKSQAGKKPGDPVVEQALSYFGTELNERKQYDSSFKLLELVPNLGDYLGDEVGIERMRTFAGKGDAKGAMEQFVRRIEEVTAALDQFHFMYHKDKSIQASGHELHVMLEKQAKAVEAALRTQFDAPRETMKKLPYLMSLAGHYSQLREFDNEVDLLVTAAGDAKYREMLGFRHILFRSVYRIFEAPAPGLPD